jgi:RimJ/RimL family protein N-acetyltransferase
MLLENKDRNMPNVIKRTPKECTITELDMFEKLVKEGGEVNSEGLRLRIEDALCLAWIEADDGKVIGVGAIKRPYEQYRSSVFKKAGSEEVAIQFALELGWVFISPAFRGKGLSTPLIKKLLSSAENGSIFATTRENNEAMKAILANFGFQESGEPYKSSIGNHKLVLFIMRDA